MQFNKNLKVVMTKEEPTKNNKSNFNIDLQYLKDLSFENPSSPGIFFQQNKNAPQIKINIDVVVNKIGETSYEVILGITANAIQEEKTKHYILEIKYAAIISVKNELKEDLIKKIVMVDVPTLLLPFARNIIATTIRDGGFTALMMEPINFENLYEQHNQNQKN